MDPVSSSNESAAAFLLKQRQLAADRAAVAASDSKPHEPRDGEDDDAAERLRMLAEVRRQREQERESARRERAGHESAEPRSLTRQPIVPDPSRLRSQTAPSVSAQPPLDPEARKRQEMFADIMAERKGRQDNHSREDDAPAPIARFSRRGAVETPSFPATGREVRRLWCFV
jgi:hypothetical protein